MDIEDILFDEDNNEFLNETTGEECQEPAEWTVISALNYVLARAKGSQMSNEFWKANKAPLDYLTSVLGLSRAQAVFLAILVETGETMELRDIAKYLHSTRLSIMTYLEEIEGLVEKRWVEHRVIRHCNDNEGYALAEGVVTALRNNTAFVPEKISGLDIQTFVDKLERHIDKNMYNHQIDFEDDERWMVQLCKANTHLPLCNEVLSFDELHVQSLLLMIVFDYAQWAGSDGEGLQMNTIERLYPDDYETFCIRAGLRDGSHELIQRGYIEHKCEDGLANGEQYMLTRKCKEKFLSGYTPSRKKCKNAKRPNQDLKRHDVIKAKSMFYNPTEKAQIERLTSLLSQENLPDVQERLARKGLRKGFACLFFGGPGTGKTETVLQIARQTGRDIMQIDIASMRDKYVGESEKNIKAVFTRYRQVCRQCEVMPILFFNEADAIFGKRTAIGDFNPSLNKMDNAMQNIILQEMEDLEGILIATTNLTDNLDNAFERRFLFKVEFRKPDDEVKTKLWRSMLENDITEDEARRLAVRYDFSGGQIENIARKCAIEYILSGNEAGFDMIEEFCEHELIKNKTTRKTIGFQHY